MIMVGIAVGLVALLVISAVMNGLPLDRAVEIAVDFTHGSIMRTYRAGTDLRYGVNFEEGIPRFLKQLGL